MRVTDKLLEYSDMALEVLADDISHPVDNVIAPVLNGLAHGLDDVHQMITHPVETLYQVTLFGLDAAIIISHASQNYSDPQLQPCREALHKKDSFYSNACRRMQERIDHFEKLGKEFSAASHPEKLQMATRFFTSIYVPGTVLKATQGVSNLAKTGRFNPAIYKERRLPILTKLKEIKEDFRWHLENWLDQTEVRLTPPHYSKKYWSSIDDIRAASKTTECEYAYVILPNGEFRAITQDLGGHGNLTNGQPILMGGDLVAKNGRIIKIDNRTGDYTPYVEPIVMTHVFKGLGVPEINIPGVIQETYSRANSIASGMRRSNAIKFSRVHPLAVVATDLFHTHESYQALFVHASQSVPTTEPLRAAYATAAASAPAKKSAPTQPAQSATAAYEKAFEATTQFFQSMPTPQYAASASTTPPQPSKPPISAAQKAAAEHIARTNAETAKLNGQARASLNHVSTMLAHPKPNDWRYAAGLSQGIGTAANFLSMSANLCGSRKAANAFSAAASGGMMAASGFSAAAATGMSFVPGLNIVGGIGMAICGVMSAIFDDSDEAAAAQHAKEMRELHAAIQEQATRVIEVLGGQIEQIALKMDSQHCSVMNTLMQNRIWDIEKFGQIHSALLVIRDDYVKTMENNFRAEYGQLQEFHYLQTTLDRRLVNAVRIALNQKNLKEFERFAKELHQAIIAESFGSDSMTGRDLELTGDNELINVRVLQPFYNGRNTRQIAVANIDALLRYTVSIKAREKQAFTMPNPILLIDRAWIFLELFRTHLQENHFQLSPEAHRNFSDVIAFLIEKQKQLADVDLKKLFATLIDFSKKSLRELRENILEITKDRHSPLALIDHHTKRLNALEEKINAMLEYGSKKVVVYPQENADFLETIRRYAEKQYTIPSHHDESGIKNYLLKHYPQLFMRDPSFRGNDYKYKYQYNHLGSNGHRIPCETVIYDAMGQSGHGVESTKIQYRELRDQFRKDFLACRDALKKGKFAGLHRKEKSYISGTKYIYETWHSRNFGPLTPSSGSIHLGTWQEARNYNSILKRIPDEAFEQENKGYGEIKLTYDARMSNDTLSVTFKGVFEPYDREFPIIKIFEEKYETPIVASLYDNNVDSALYDLWHTGNVFAFSKAPGEPIKIGEDTFNYFTSVPQLYFRVECLDTLPNFFAQLPENANVTQIKEQLDALQKGIDAKEQRQKEHNLKALSFSRAEKRLVLIRLFSEIWAPASQRLSVPRLSQVLETQGVDGLVKTIDELITTVEAFQPKGTADELPFLIGQMQTLFDQAKIVEREVPRQEAQPQRAAESDDDGYETADGEDELLRVETKDCGLDDAQIEKTGKHAIRLIPVSNFSTPLAQATFFKKLKREKPDIRYRKVDGHDVVEVPLERKPR